MMILEFVVLRQSGIESVNKQIDSMYDCHHICLTHITEINLHAVEALLHVLLHAF